GLDFLRQVGYRLHDLIAIHHWKGLVLIGQMGQVRGCRTYIGKFHDEVWGHFLLDAQTPLLDARRLQMGLHDKHGGLNNLLRGVREDLVYDGKEPFADKLRRARGVAREVEPGIGIHRRVKDSRSASDYHLVVPELRGPRKTKTRRPVRLVRKH